MKPSERIEATPSEALTRFRLAIERIAAVPVNGWPDLEEVVTIARRALDLDGVEVEPDPSEAVVPGEYRETVFASGRVVGVTVNKVTGQTENGEEVSGG